jgi:hypothetical protein
MRATAQPVCQGRGLACRRAAAAVRFAELPSFSLWQHTPDSRRLIDSNYRLEMYFQLEISLLPA